MTVLNTRNMRACVLAPIDDVSTLSRCRARWTRLVRMKVAFRCMPLHRHDPDAFSRSHLHDTKDTLRRSPGRPVCLDSFTLSRQGSFTAKNRPACHQIHTVGSAWRVSNWPLACVEKSGRKAARYYILSIYFFLSLISRHQRRSHAVVYPQHAWNSIGIHSQQRRRCSESKAQTLRKIVAFCTGQYQLSHVDAKHRFSPASAKQHSSHIIMEYFN